MSGHDATPNPMSNEAKLKAGIKHFLNQFHIWRLHFQLWDCLNDKPCFHYSYQPPGYWTDISDPRAIEALMMDDELGLGLKRLPGAEIVEALQHLADEAIKHRDNPHLVRAKVLSHTGILEVIVQSAIKELLKNAK